MAKTIEIDEDEFNRLQTLRGVAAKIVENPSAKKLLEQAHKLVDPNARTPTIDAEARQMAPIEELRKQMTEGFEKLTKSQEERERQARIDEIATKQMRDKEALRRREHYTDAGIQAIEKIMEEKGLLDVADAVAIFERSNPPPAPITPGVGSWGFNDMSGESDKNITDLIATRGQNDQIADRMAREALNDFRSALGGQRR